MPSQSAVPCHPQVVTACCPLLSPPGFPQPLTLPTTPRLSPTVIPSCHPSGCPHQLSLLSPPRPVTTSCPLLSPPGCPHLLSPPVPRQPGGDAGALPGGTWLPAPQGQRGEGTSQGVAVLSLLYSSMVLTMVPFVTGFYSLSDGASSGRTSAKRKKGRSPVVMGEVHTVIFCNVS